MQPNYTYDDIKRYREETSCSIYEAIAHFKQNHLLECVHVAHENKDFDLLCDVVRQLVQAVRF